MTSAQRRLIVLASGCAAGLALFPFTTRPLFWDEIAYMDLAFHPSPQSWVLNRFAHIYAMKPFMALAGDPYVGAQAFWCFLFAITVGAIVDAALRLPAGERARVLALSLFLIAGQVALFRNPGLVHADYTIMAVITVSICTALHRVRAGRWTAGAAFLLGALFLFGMKSKEVALPLVLLPALFFLTRSGSLRFDREAVHLAGGWVLGAIAVAIAIVALDGWLLGDPLFSVRPSSWQHLLEYNLRPEWNSPASESWLGLMLRRAGPSFVLYLVAGPLWLVRTRDVRLVLLYAFPLLFLLLLPLLRTSVAMEVVERYVLPILPLHCFLASLALWEAADDVPWQRRLTWATLVVVVALGARPAWTVATALAERRAQKAGENRFRGFYEVARDVEIAQNAMLFVSPRLYGGAIRPNSLGSLARLNFSVPLPRSQVVKEGSWTGRSFDYAVLSSTEWHEWSRSRPPDERSDTIRSSDGEVVLVCLRAPCPRRS